MSTDFILQQVKGVNKSFKLEKFNVRKLTKLASKFGKVQSKVQNIRKQSTNSCQKNEILERRSPRDSLISKTNNKLNATMIDGLYMVMVQQE